MADPGRRGALPTPGLGDVRLGTTPGDLPRRKRARREIDSPAEPTRALREAPGRRLTGAERRALQERRKAKMPPPPPPPPPRPSAVPRVPRGQRSDIPRMPRVQRPDARPTGASRGLLVLGAVLITGLTVLALAGGRLFGAAGDDEPTGDRGAIGAPGFSSPIAALGTPDSRPDVAALGRPGPGRDRRSGAGPGDGIPVVCLDPGHGGRDRGFERADSFFAPAMQEAILTLQYAWDLEARLRQHGFDVVLTRRTDTDVNADGRDVNGDGKTARDDPRGETRNATLDELQARINVCNEAKADLLVSIHVNGFPRADVRGFEVWYTQEREFGDQSHRFATLAYRELAAQFEAFGFVTEGRGVLADSEAEVDAKHGVFKNFVILGPAIPGQIEPSRMPGAIVETLFISNDQDAAFLATAAGREAIVDAYELAILRYFEEYPA